MAVTRLGNRRPGRWLRGALLSGLLAVQLLGASARAEEAPASAPPPPDAQAALDVAADAAQELDRLRFAAEPAPDRVASLVKEARAALDAADAALKDRLAQLAPPDKKPPAAPATKDLAAQAARLRTDRCRLAIARGDLATRAVAALPRAHADRGRYTSDALAAFRALRVDYCDLALGMMGFIGEARVQRVAGSGAAAKAALQPVLQMAPAPKNPAAVALRRVALVEDLEATMLATPQEAPAAVAALRKAPEFKDAPPWQARLDFVDARLRMAEIENPPASEADPNIQADRIAKTAALLRTPALVAAVENSERLALLAKLDGLSGGKVLKREELLEWADWLLAAGRTDVGVLYERARAAAGPSLSSKQLMSYIALAARQNRPMAIAQACDQLLATVPANDPQRPALLRWRAASLLKVYRQAGAEPPPELVMRTQAALKAIVESPSPDAASIDALRQWVAIKCADAGPRTCLSLIEAHKDLAAIDTYLLYAWAAGRWEELSEDPAGASAPARARDIVTDLDKLAAMAAAAKDQPLLVAGALLHAQVLAGPPLKDLKAALHILDGKQFVYLAEPTMANAATWLRAEVLLGLGLAEEASKALAQVPEGAAGGSATTRLALAEALAARYGHLAAEGRDEARRRVVELSTAAMAGGTPGNDAHTRVALRAARCLVAMEACAEAKQVLEKVLASDAAKKDVTVVQRATLLMADALEGGGQAAEAAAVLGRLAEQFPQSADIRLALGRCQWGTGKHAEAIETFRAARALCREGAEDWCRATLALTDAQASANQADVAADILRVAEALYPSFGSPELRGQLRQSRARLAEPAARGRSPVR